MSLRRASLALLALVALAFIGLAAPVTPQAPSRTTLTIYTRDLALARETRTLDVGSSRDTVRIGGIPERLDPSSIRLVPEGRARVTRLAYRFDVASGDRVLEQARGRRVRISLRDNRSVEGVLVGSDGAWLMVRSNGALESVSRQAVEDVRLADPPANLAFEPTIDAVLEGASGRVDAELSYLTGGLSWAAEHSVVRTGETSAQWGSSIVIENTSGKSYDARKVALVAGEPRRVTGMPPPMPARNQMEMLATAMEKDAADVSEQSFAEYHLYTRDRPALVRDRETQTLTMLETRATQVSPRYVARPHMGVTAQLEIKNTRAAGLGVPLPAGRVRFYEKDADGDLHFTGESRIKHTPEGETMTLDVGTVFDVVAERREIYNRRISDREREYQIEVKLRNRKKNDVRVVVEEPVSGDHEVIKKSHEFTRKDANTLQFTILVRAGQEEILTYTVRARF
jgi:hypothetical protein